LGLGEILCRLGEIGSPKRGHDGNLYHFECDFLSRREVLSSELWTLLPRLEWLAKASYDVELMHFSLNLRPGEVCVILSEGVTRPGE